MNERRGRRIVGVRGRRKRKKIMIKKKKKKTRRRRVIVDVTKRITKSECFARVSESSVPPGYKKHGQL